ncbi:MAG: hypothetical protein JSR45_03150 [Proteobacteria bacterium]|nr:hypothetical protein [Pseudomonadota bacterium]
MIDAPRPAFLAPVGPEERNPWRIGAWLCAAVAAYLLTRDLMVLALTLALPHAAMEALLADQAFSGPQRLELEAILFGCLVAAYLIRGVVLLAFSGNIFRRPAWTFVTPVRRWAWSLAGQGAAWGALLIAAVLAVDWSLGEPNPAPALDAHFALQDRAIFAAALAPLALLMVTVQEIVFRGVVLQATSAFIRNRYVVALLNGVLYALTQRDPTTAAMLEGTLVGAALTWAVLELGGLEFGIGVQFLRLWAALMAGPLFTSEIGKKPDWTVSPAEACEIGVTFVAILAGAWLVKRVNRRRLGL